MVANVAIILEYKHWFLPTCDNFWWIFYSWQQTNWKKIGYIFYYKFGNIDKLLTSPKWKKILVHNVCEKTKGKKTIDFIDTFRAKIQGEASSFGIRHSICFIAFLEHLLRCDRFSNQQLFNCLFYNLKALWCGERCLCHLNVKMLGMFFFVFLTMGKPSFILPNFGRKIS
jgi:hypothetical protein